MAKRRGHGDGSIYYSDTKGRWIGRLDLGRDGTGKRRRTQVNGRTRAEVRERLRELQERHRAGLPVGEGHLTVGDLLDRWLRDVVPARGTVKSSNTVDNYAWAVNRYLVPHLGAHRLRELTPEHVENMLRSLVDDHGVGKSAAGRVRSVLAMALRHAQRRDLVARNAADLAEIPAGARPTAEAESLTVQQAAALLEAAENDDAGPLVVVGLMLGLRPGELCGLRWIDVDLDGATLTVRQARKRERENGREVLRMGEPKTKRSRRTVALPRPVVDALGRQRAIQARTRLAAGELWQDHGLVFATSIGTAIDPANLRRTFSRLVSDARIEGRWTPLSLRHSAASLLSAAGVPIEEVADLLGHVDTRMLEKHYRHQVKPSVAAAVAPMEAMFGR